MPRWGAVGAVAFLTVLAAVIVLHPSSTPTPNTETMRQGPAGPSSPQLILPREGSTMPQGSIEFRWTPAAGALFYEIRVMNADGDMVWEARAEGADTQIPATTRLSAGRKYYASVTAALPDGKSLKSSLVGFEITPGR
ncbi:MAG: hypothetical protein U0Q18_25690 [Bryobacteraceae bacterium]